MGKLVEDSGGNLILLANGSPGAAGATQALPVPGPGLKSKPEKPAQPQPQSKPQAGTGRPANVDPLEWARRMDAVRDAAREFETFTDQDVQEFLRGRTQRTLTAQEISSFTADVHAQQLDDLCDMLDQAERGALRGRRTVKVTAPRGYIRKTLNALPDDQLKELTQRLRSRGWDDKQVASLQNRLPETRKAAVEGLSEGDLALVEYDVTHAGPTSMLDAARELVTEIVAAMPAPVINFETPRRRAHVRRDPETRLITDVEEIDLDGRR